MIAAQSMRRIFLWPTVIATTSLIGLLSALIGDGIWDGLSWATLALPAGIGLLAMISRSRHKPEEPAR